MRTLLLSLTAMTLVGNAAAQRRARLGPIVSTISIEDAGGTGHAYSSAGAVLALLSGDDGEIGVSVARYGDLSNTSCVRQLTFFAVESNYYPVGARGVAPFASTQLGLARVTDADVGLLGACTTPEATNEIGLGFGLGVRLNAGNDVAAVLDGRFLQVPSSAIQGLEGRANVSVAFGKPRQGELLNGTLGPVVGFLAPLSGSMRGRGPLVGVRFRRDTRKSGTLGLQIDYAPLRITEGCPSACEPAAILFAPGYEASLHQPWGRLYGTLGFLLAGFPSEGADRGIGQGAHGGLGADIFSGRAVMWNVGGRVLWLQRQTGENVFLLQLGVGVSPKLGAPTPTRAR